LPRQSMRKRGNGAATRCVLVSLVLIIDRDIRHRAVAGCYFTSPQVV
jgi:hypothetical protein